MLKLKKNKTLSVIIAMIMIVGLVAGNLNIASANPVQHEVTFHANGGKFADGKKELKKSFDEGTAWSEATANIEHPKKDGSNFLGWSLALSIFETRHRKESRPAYWAGAGGRNWSFR